MCATVVLGRDFDIHVVLAAVDIVILDAAVREMHLPVEVRQVMVVCPLLDLALVAIRPSIRVRPAAVPLMQPSLVFALQLVVQPYALNRSASLLEPLYLALIGAINLGIVFELALAFQSCIERLASVPVAVSIRLQQVPASVRQDYRLFAIARDADHLDETLFSEVSQVAITRIRGPIGMVAEVAGRHDPKSTDRRQRPALRPAERVFAVTGGMDDFPVASAGQIESAREHVARVGAVMPRIQIPIRPARIIAISMVGAVAGLTPMIMPVARLVVVILDVGGAAITSER